MTAGAAAGAGSALFSADELLGLKKSAIAFTAFAPFFSAGAGVLRLPLAGAGGSSGGS